MNKQRKILPFVVLGVMFIFRNYVIVVGQVPAAAALQNEDQTSAVSDAAGRFNCVRFTPVAALELLNRNTEPRKEVRIINFPNELAGNNRCSKGYDQLVAAVESDAVQRIGVYTGEAAGRTENEICLVENAATLG